MSAADSRLSAFTEHLELVTKEGPRAIWQNPGRSQFTAICADCRIATPFTHRSDADEWMDMHDCVGSW